MADRPLKASKPRNFNLFDAFLRNYDLLLYLSTQHLEPQEFFILYSVSKRFHYLVNLNITSFILSSARRWARLTPTRPVFALERPHHTKIPGVAGNPSEKYQIYKASTTASHRLMKMCGTEPTPAGTYSDHDITTILPFRCYGHLCSTDPAQRDFSAEVKHRPKTGVPTSLTSTPLDDVSTHSTSESAANVPDLPPKPVIRDVPTFRYLKFLLDRARTIQLIIHHMASHGHRLPPKETPAVLARISLAMDIPLNARRAAVFRNGKYWTNKDLFVANLFFIKLDMCFTDPVDGNGETSMRKLLLSQRSLVPLEQTLARTQCTSLFETLKLYVRTLHVPSPPNRGYDIFGVPAAEVGMIGTEGWGMPANQYDARRGQTAPETSTQAAPQTEDEAEEQGVDLGQPTDDPTTQAAQPSEAAPPERPRLLRPDQLLMIESVRPRLPLQHHYLRMVSYGYLDPWTLKDLPDPGAAPADEAQQAAGVDASNAEFERLRQMFEQAAQSAQAAGSSMEGLQHMFTVDASGAMDTT